MAEHSVYTFRAIPPDRSSRSKRFDTEYLDFGGSFGTRLCDIFPAKNRPKTDL